MATAYWTPSDELEYSRVANGLSQVQGDLDNGELDPTDGGPLLQQLATKRETLDQRRQAAEVQKLGQQRMQVSDELAFQQSVQLRNMQQMANEFATTMPVFKDPETGKTTYFYPRGQFEPMQGVGEAEEETPEMADLSGFVEDEPEPAPQPRQDESRPPPPGAWTQTIQNGASVTQVHRDSEGRVIGLDGSPLGLQGILGSAGRASNNLPEPLAAEAWQRAEAAVPGEMSAERFEQVQQEFAKQLPGVEREHEERQLGQMYGLSLNQIRVARREAAATVQGMHPRQAQRAFPQVFNQILRSLGSAQRQHATAAAKEQADARKKEEEITVKRKDDLFDKEYAKLTKDLEAAQKQQATAAANDTPYEPPEHLKYLKDDNELIMLAQDRARKKFEMIYKRDWETGKPIDQQTPTRNPNHPIGDPSKPPRGERPVGKLPQEGTTQQIPNHTAPQAAASQPNPAQQEALKYLDDLIRKMQ
jgi:hypothetical protein